LQGRQSPAWGKIGEQYEADYVSVENINSSWLDLLLEIATRGEGRVGEMGKKAMESLGGNQNRLRWIGSFSEKSPHDVWGGGRKKKSDP